MKAGTAVLFFLSCVLGAAAQPAAPPTEHVTVTAPKDVPQPVIDHFIQSFAAPSHLTGKVGRWEEGICPVTVGLGRKFAAFITARIRARALQVGSPVNQNRSCRPNIEIVFTTTPQAMADALRKDHKVYLGYSEGAAQADRLVVVNHPIQAWYLTATKDLHGDVQVDSFYNMPTDPVWDLAAELQAGGTGMGLTGVRAVTGGRLKDGLRTIFHHVIIAADPTKLADYEVGTLADYIAMLSLTQLNSLDVCQTLPSIINLLAKHCPGPPNQISDSDLGYLRGLYSMSADGNLRVQQDGIAHQMKQTLAGH